MLWNLFKKETIDDIVEKYNNNKFLSIINALEYISKRYDSEFLEFLQKIDFINTVPNFAKTKTLRYLHSALNQEEETHKNINHYKSIKNALNWIYSHKLKPDDQYKSQDHINYCTNKIDTISVKHHEILQINQFNLDIFKLNFSPQLLDNLSSYDTMNMFLKKHNVQIKYIDSNYSPEISNSNDIQYLTKNIKWFDASGEYLESLSLIDKLTIIGYSTSGYKYVNNYILKDNFELENIIQYTRDKYHNYEQTYYPLYMHIIKIFNDNNYKIKGITDEQKESVRYTNFIYMLPNIQHEIIYTAIKMFIKDLYRIISNAPMLEHDLYVYRGERNFYHSKDETKFVVPTFHSTSINPDIAINFSKIHGVFKRIKVQKGTKCIYIQSMSQFNEVEILTNPGTVFEINNIKLIDFIDQNEENLKLKLCSPVFPIYYIELTAHAPTKDTGLQLDDDTTWIEPLESVTMPD